jgi:hypothetical protein
MRPYVFPLGIRSALWHCSEPISIENQDSAPHLKERNPISVNISLMRALPEVLLSRLCFSNTCNPCKYPRLSSCRAEVSYTELKLDSCPISQVTGLGNHFTFSRVGSSARISRSTTTDPQTQSRPALELFRLPEFLAVARQKFLDSAWHAIILVVRFIVGHL